ncbi:MAG: hypothetical protein IIC59_00915 [Proteobacteria bacterium]|nr:hypothetical protein [Pseudomonadota bacterium]MCH8173721.1 hypothetical protein [Pseudomonadota bacterium]
MATAMETMTMMMMAMTIATMIVTTAMMMAMTAVTRFQSAPKLALLPMTQTCTAGLRSNIEAKTARWSRNLK